MMKFAVLCSVLFLACNSGDPVECEIADVPETVEQCECIGGRVAPNPGGGAECDAGEVQVSSQIQSGLEPGACCVAE